MKQKHFYILITILAVFLMFLIGVAVRVTRGDIPMDSSGESNTSAQHSGFAESTVPSDPQADATNPTQSEGTVPSAPTETEVTEPSAQPSEPTPTEPLPTQTQPTLSGDYIGTLYTRDQLMAMSNEKFSYGPGPASKNQRAIYAVSAQKKYAQYGANFIGPDNNCIYLTFDCGYEYTATDASGSKYRVTEKILDVLKEKNAKGVFFITMHYAKSQPDLVQRMIDEGHVIGNHTNNHPVMPDISIDKMVEEVMSLHNYVLDNFGYKMTLFRPPTGAYSIRSLAVVQSLGYKNVHWSFAYADWTTDNQPDVASSLQKVKDSAHNGAIYLLHAVSTTNASLLGDAIDFFRSEGYQLRLFE